MARRSPVLVTSASALLVASVLLTGCTTPEPAPTTPSTTTPSESSTPTPSTEPTEPSATSSSTPVDVPCTTLVSLQTMYDFNPNFSLLGSWNPDAGTPAAEAVAARGTVCRWQNGTSGEVIDISVASFDEATLEAKATATSSSSTKVDSYGSDEAYFSSNGGIGEAVVFHGAYWVVVRSVAFFEAGDAQPIVSSVLAAL
jgi:hypothetical protein